MSGGLPSLSSLHGTMIDSLTGPGFTSLLAFLSIAASTSFLTSTTLASMHLRVTFWVVCGLDYPFRKRDSEDVNSALLSERAAVVQWIKRLPENQLAAARVGSNPGFCTLDVLTSALIILYTSSKRSKQPQRQSGYNEHTDNTASVLSSID